MIVTCIQLTKQIYILQDFNVISDNCFHFVIREWNNLTYDTILVPSIKDFKTAIFKKMEPSTLYY